MVTDGKLAYSNLLTYSLSFPQSRDAIASNKLITDVQFLDAIASVDLGYGSDGVSDH